MPCEVLARRPAVDLRHLGSRHQDCAPLAQGPRLGGIRQLFCSVEKIFEQTSKEVMYEETGSSFPGGHRSSVVGKIFPRFGANAGLRSAVAVWHVSDRGRDRLLWGAQLESNSTGAVCGAELAAAEHSRTLV
jgi:hypothetical protein